MKRLTRLSAAALMLIAPACERAALTAPHLAVQASAAPEEVPFFEQFDGDNCGEFVTFTFTGTARIQQQGDRYLLVARGTVTTSNGFSGTFNRQYVFKGDRVAILRFHDMEVSSDTGQRVVFSMGMYLYSLADGTHVVDFEKYGGGVCLGF